MSKCEKKWTKPNIDGVGKCMLGKKGKNKDALNTNRRNNHFNFQEC